MLHECGIVHANLSPSSIVVGEDGHILISEFGDARLLRDGARSGRDHAADRSGEQEMAYRAPELVLGWDHDYAVDWWSFGLVLHWICTGRVSASQIWLSVRHVLQDGRSTPSWTE